MGRGTQTIVLYFTGRGFPPACKDPAEEHLLGVQRGRGDCRHLHLWEHKATISILLPLISNKSWTKGSDLSSKHQQSPTVPGPGDKESIHNQPALSNIFVSPDYSAGTYARPALQGLVSLYHHSPTRYRVLFFPLYLFNILLL